MVVVLPETEQPLVLSFYLGSTLPVGERRPATDIAVYSW